MDNPIDIIQHIDPSILSYEDWLLVGMALKTSGATAIDWDDWSRRDQDRYVPGECFRKWDSFHGSEHPVTIASLIAIAKDQGWRPPVATGHALEWDAVIQNPDESDNAEQQKYRVVDPDWVEERHEDLIEPGDDWDPVQDLVRYLGILFNADEHVGYVSESWLNKEAGRHLPKRGHCDRTAGQLIQLLNDCDSDIGSVIGDTTQDVGAWIRFNPLDGQGCKDANVTSFRFALVESDEIPTSKQYALLKEIELPIAALVHSGGKSVHAIVRIDADTMDEYRRRVNFLYEVCGRNGLKPDRQNRNPSRLSRMPGIMRGDRKQWLVETNTGKASWNEWEEWIVDLNDDLPNIEDLLVTSVQPELAPELIKGILRVGHKMLLSGPSKAHKSFALIQLAIAIAEGHPWWGWGTKQGRVLYVNLELDAKSCVHRFWATYQGANVQPTPGTIDIWHLRGNAAPMDKLAPKLIRRAQKKGYAAIIIDPVYKILTGDENSAEQMARFCNQFDRICTVLGAATIVCHHHSKGAQGQKQSQDRSSGSGVFGRDPDAIIDLIELGIDDDRRKQIENSWELTAIKAHIDKVLPDGWQGLVPQDDLLVADKLFDWAVQQAPREPLMSVRSGTRTAAQLATGWRVEATLREFAPCPIKTMFFRYPRHVADWDGLLADAKAEGEDVWNGRKRYTTAELNRRRARTKSNRLAAKREELEIGVKSTGNGEISLSELAEFLGCTEKTARKRVADHPKYRVDNGIVVETERIRS